MKRNSSNFLTPGRITSQERNTPYFEVKPFSELKIIYPDAKMYSNFKNKPLLNGFFSKNAFLDKLCENHVSFLIGEKGTGKTAYATYLVNNEYKGIKAHISYLDQTDYLTFINLKKHGELELTQFATVWKVILYVLMTKFIKNSEKNSENRPLKIFDAFKPIDDLKKCIDSFYDDRFVPEVKFAVNFAIESERAVKAMSDHLGASISKKNKSEYSSENRVSKLMQIQDNFEKAYDKINFDNDHVLFIDGLDVKPAALTVDEYLFYISSLAEAAEQINRNTFMNKQFGIRFVLLLRPDVFSKLKLQNINLMFRDNSVCLNWGVDKGNFDKSDLFITIDNILASQQDKKCNQTGAVWENYFPFYDPDCKPQWKLKYGKQTSFLKFLSLTYHRPRDFILMLRVLHDLHSHNKDKYKFNYETDFLNHRFQGEYSKSLLGELQNEMSFYNNIEDFQLFERFFLCLNESSTFGYKMYVEGFNQYKQDILKMDNNLPKIFQSADVFLQFLYEFNVIGFVKMKHGKEVTSWCFRERDLSNSNTTPLVEFDRTYQVFAGLQIALKLNKNLSQTHIVF